MPITAAYVDAIFDPDFELLGSTVRLSPPDTRHIEISAPSIYKFPGPATWQPRKLTFPDIHDA